MAKTAFPSGLALGDLASGYPCKQTTIRELRDWDRVLGRRPFFLDFGSQATTSNDSGGANIAALSDVWVPDYASGWNLVLVTTAYVTANTGHLWIDDLDNVVSGTSIPITTTTPGTETAEIRVVITTTGVIDFMLRGYIETSGTLTCAQTKRMTAWFEDTAG